MAALEYGGEFLGGDHPDLAVSMNNIAAVHQWADRHEEALRWAKKALAQREPKLGLDHPWLAHSLFTIGQASLDSGRHDEAIAAFERIERLLAGNEHLPVLLAESRLHLAEVLWATERDRERGLALARAVLRERPGTEEATTAAEKIAGWGHPVP